MIDLAAAVFEQRDALAAAQPRLQELCRRVDRAVDMSPLDWSLFYALAMSFKPDRIVELGRGFGNSTAAFTQAAQDLGACEVVSIDRDRGHTWETQTLPKLEGAIDPAWLGHLDALQADILDVTAQRLFGDARRVILLWDAHGDELGRYVLGALLPALQRREHIVILHDVTDTRLQHHQDPAYGTGDAMTYWQGHLVCSFEEIYAAMDFVTRNGIETETPAYSFDTWLRQHEGPKAVGMRALFSDVLGDPYLDGAYNGGHWLYFDLATRTSQAPLAFPQPPQRGLAQRLVSKGLGLEKVDALVWRLAPEDFPTALVVGDCVCDLRVG